MASGSSAHVDGGVLRVGGKVFALRQASGSELAEVVFERGMVHKIVVGVAWVVLGVPMLVCGLLAVICTLAIPIAWFASGSPEGYQLRLWIGSVAVAAVCFVLLGLVRREPTGWRLRILWSGGQTAIELFDRDRAPLEELQSQISHAASDDTYRGPLITIRDVIVGNRIDSGGGPVQMGGSGNQA